jgi:hypothetical protein
MERLRFCPTSLVQLMHGVYYLVSAFGDCYITLLQYHQQMLTG